MAPTSRSRVPVPKPNRTTFIALVVLEDAIRKLQFSGPLTPPEHGVRLALAYLYSLTLSKNREPFDTLWRTLIGHDHQPPTFRSTWAGTQLARICDDIGVSRDIDLSAALAQAATDNAKSRR